MKKTRSSVKPLAGRVALVAGATRGAGRGIARALGDAGATVYRTGRSVKGKPSPYRRPETIDETAAMTTTAGGRATAVRVDHTNEAEVKALFRRIRYITRRRLVAGGEVQLLAAGDRREGAPVAAVAQLG